MTEIPAETPLWRRIVLPASILLNLFLLALIGGHMLHAHGRSESVGLPFARALSRAEELLPPQDAAAFGSVMRGDAAQYAQAAQQLRDARQELNRQLVAEPFNPEATRRAFHDFQMAWDHFLNDFSTPLVDALAQISPEGRRKLMAGTPFVLSPQPNASPPNTGK
jgi:uncharacterized membrane protein